MKKRIISAAAVLAAVSAAAVLLAVLNKGGKGAAEEVQTETQAETLPLTLTLTLEYDDRYSLDDLIEGYFVVTIYDEEAVSYQVENAQATETPDDSVISLEDGSCTELAADGVGDAVMLIAPESMQGEINEDNISEYEEYIITVEVTVEPARLTLMFLAGQSNAEGNCSSSTGNEYWESVACEDGTVYSTYAPSGISTGAKITGIEFSQAGTAAAAEDIVAGSLTSDVSVSGTVLEYSLDTLTESGNGKIGPDSGLAYEWNLLTGDKVWVVNAAWGATSIAVWQKGESVYDRAADVFALAQQTYTAEIEAGHYTAGETLLFWLQGESDNTMETETYYSYFTAMCADMKETFSLDAIGIIMVCSNCGEYGCDDEIEMSGPRIAQYLAGQDSELSYVYIVSNVGEQWISDEGVAEYFSEAYPEGYITYPKRETSERYASSLPATVDEIHSDAHYSQTGHNENGITAADGMYAVLYGSDEEVSVEWRTENGLGTYSLILGTGEEADLIAAAEPVYLGKNVTYEISGDCVSYDFDTASITGISCGSAYIKAYLNGQVIGVMEITVVETAVNGLVYNEENGWAYYAHSIIDTTYDGLAENDEGWWYISGGYIDLTYTGIARYGHSWWYVTDGRLDLTFTGIASCTRGTWYLENGRVTLTYNGEVTIDGVTYTIENSKVVQ